MSILQYLFSFYGRIGRGKLWLGLLIVWVLMIACTVLVPLIDGVPIAVAFSEESDYQPGNIALAFLGIVTILGTIMAAAISVKRCHDRGQSGWWYLLSLIPIVGVIWWVVNLGILSGDKGPNKYGPDPRGIGAEVFA